MGLSAGGNLALAHDANLLVDVVSQGDGAPQRHLLRCIAADDGIFHGEIGIVDFYSGNAIHLHAAPREIGVELSERRGVVDEFIGQAFDEVVLFIQKRQPARLRLLDDVDFDASDHGQASAL